VVKMSKEILVSDVIVKAIIFHDKKANKSAEVAKFHAIKTGENLLIAKSKVNIREWGEWLKNESQRNSEFRLGTTQQAKKYTDLAENKELARVVFVGDDSFNLNGICDRIKNATEEEKAEAEKIKQAAVEAEEQKRLEAEAKKKEREETKRVETVGKAKEETIIPRAKEQSVIDAEIVENNNKTVSNSKKDNKKEIVSKTLQSEEAEDSKEIIENLKTELQQITSEFEEVVVENESTAKVFDANDHLTAALSEVKKYREQNIILQGRVNGLMNEKNQAIRSVKYWKNEFLRLDKQLNELDGDKNE